jgi:asparagine N-glycosylation enzyme membrane subunit Stt3
LPKISAFERVKLDRNQVLELLALAGVTALALALRWTASLQNGMSVFPDDDSYWHFHLDEQIVQFGHRLNPDPQAWLPLGRPDTQPPLFHYAVAYAYLFLKSIGSGVSLFTVAYYSDLPAIILGVVAIYLLVRELYGTVPALTASSYSRPCRPR